MNIKLIQFGSDDYQKTCDLRNQILRVPLGLSLFDEDLSQESNQFHFGLFDPTGNLLACVIAVAISTNTAKIRQMAVAPSHQRMGYGHNILRFLENNMLHHGINQFYLSARLTAVSFYEQLGYLKTGEPFIEVGIPHIKMEKLLPAKNQFPQASQI